MIADAAAFARPLLVYELPWLGRSKKPGLVAGIKRHVRERREQRGMAGLPADPLDHFYDMLTRMGRARPRRNVLGLTQKLYQAGIARPFSSDADLTWEPAAVTRETQDRLVAEIKALWAARRSARLQLRPSATSPAPTPARPARYGSRPTASGAGAQLPSVRGR